MQRIIVLILFIFILPLSAHAENRYVTDRILVSLRPAQDDTSAPLEYLTTGIRVEVIEDFGAFLKLKSASGTVGFARSKYFIPTPPAGVTVAAPGLQQELTAIVKRNEELTAEVQRLKSIPTATANSALQKELEQYRAEHTAIIEESDQLKKEVSRLKETDKKGSMTPLAGSQLQWFLAGAAIMLLGWFAGRSSRSKRHF